MDSSECCLLLLNKEENIGIFKLKKYNYVIRYKNLESPTILGKNERLIQHIEMLEEWIKHITSH